MGNIDLMDYGKVKNRPRGPNNYKVSPEKIKEWRKKLGWDKIPYLK